MNKALKHQDRKGEKMKANQGFREPFVITRKAPEAGQPAETALNDPATGQKRKAAFGFGQPDDDQIDAFCLSCLISFFTRVALVDKGDFDAVAGRILNVLSQFGDRVAALLIGAGDVQRKQVAQRVDRHVRFAAFAPLGAVVARPLTTFRAGLQHDRRCRLATTVRRSAPFLLALSLEMDL